MAERVPLIPIRDVVVFPKAVVPISLKRPKSVKALEEALLRDKRIFLVMQKSKEVDDPKAEDLYKVGTISFITQVQRMSDGLINILVEGDIKGEIQQFDQVEPFFEVSVEEIEEETSFTPELEKGLREIIELFRNAISLGKAVPLDVLPIIFDLSNPYRSLDMIILSLEIKGAEKQSLLEAKDLETRIDRVKDLLEKETSILQTARQIQDKTSEEIGKTAKEAFLREQLKTIEKELGIREEKEEFSELEKQIKTAGMIPDIEEKSLKELDRLKKMPPYSPEISYVRTYLDWLVTLPWSKKTQEKINVKQAEKILNEDHYGLKKVKERITEHLAVQQLTGKIKGPILCFAGPPGVGKTSIGKSIAKALGRNFVKISLGGIRDEAEIRGHRRTYVGAMPGRIIQGIKTSGSKNPVFMLDEIDKIGSDFRGDPSAALLEALDPEQNSHFSDHYLEVPFDLSDVIFITTANVLYTIPPALLDRMEVIEFPSYTEEEKLNIAQKYLMPKLLEAHGLKSSQLKISDEAMRIIISHYTREAGVRNLEREIATICRKIAKGIAEKAKTPKDITLKNIPTFLGPRRYEEWIGQKENEIGVATGLAWTEVGGVVLTIEATPMPGRGSLILTGHLGDVMKESAQAALSYTRNRAKELGINENFLKNQDVHVHVPSGAIPKDGPSAGIAMATAIVSALSKKPIDRSVGMTGEVTLRGRVLEIGGVKEKVLAAHRAGLKTVILPERNKKDLEEIPAQVKKDLKFVFAEHMDQVLKVALVEKKETRSKSNETPSISAAYPA